MIFGNRIPRDYFITSGCGESDLAIYPGAFDRALKEAGIHNYNLISYSSILPKDARKLEKIPKLEHGCVVEVIMARCDGKKGQTLTAGLIVGWLYDKNTNEKIGGIVAEYHGHGNEEEAKEQLKKSINEMFENRYKDDDKIELRDVEIFVKSFVPKKKWGNVIVAICFTNYEFPKLD